MDCKTVMLIYMLAVERGKYVKSGELSPDGE